MKKTVLTILASMAVASSMFAGEFKLSFENKISSDVVSISEGNTEFTGIKEQVTAEIETEKVDAGVSLITNLNKTDDGTIGFTEYEFDKAYVEFRPVKFLSLDFNRKILQKVHIFQLKMTTLQMETLVQVFRLLQSP